MLSSYWMKEVVLSGDWRKIEYMMQLIAWEYEKETK